MPEGTPESPEYEQLELWPGDDITNTQPDTEEPPQEAQQLPLFTKSNPLPPNHYEIEDKPPLKRRWAGRTGNGPEQDPPPPASEYRAQPQRIAEQPDNQEERQSEWWEFD